MGMPKFEGIEKFGSKKEKKKIKEG